MPDPIDIKGLCLVHVGMENHSLRTLAMQFYFEGEKLNYVKSFDDEKEFLSTLFGILTASYIDNKENILIVGLDLLYKYIPIIVNRAMYHGLSKSIPEFLKTRLDVKWPTLDKILDLRNLYKQTSIDYSDLSLIQFLSIYFKDDRLTEELLLTDAVVGKDENKSKEEINSNFNLIFKYMYLTLCKYKGYVD